MSKKYSQVTINKAREAFLAGRLQDDIARELNVPASTIGGWSVKWGWSVTRRERKRMGIRAQVVIKGTPAQIPSNGANSKLYDLVKALADDHLQVASDLVDEFRELITRSTEVASRNSQLIAENKNLRDQIAREVAKRAESVMVVHREGTGR